MKLPTIIKALSLLSVVVADSSTKGPKGPKGLRSNKRSRSKTSEDFCPLDTTCLGPANTLGDKSLFSSCDSEICYPIVGYFAWAFGPSYPAPQVPTGTIGSQGPAGANVAISFSGQSMFLLPLTSMSILIRAPEQMPNRLRLGAATPRLPQVMLGDVLASLGRLVI